MTKKELLEKRANLFEQAQAIKAKAEEEKRDLTGDESASIDQCIKDMRDLKAKADEAHKDDERNSALAEIAAQMRDDAKGAARGRGGDPSRGTPGDDPERAKAEKEANWRTWVRKSEKDATLEERAMLASVDTQGGFAVAPPALSQQFIVELENEVFLRALGDVIGLDGTEAIEFPTLDTLPEDPDWTSEVQAIDLDTATALGKRRFAPNKLSKAIVVSEKLLALAPNAVDLVRQKMVYKFATVEESNFMTGSGVNRPLGIFTASATGINTDRDMATGNASTSIQYDGLVRARGALRAQYRRRAIWIFHRDAVTQVMLLKDGHGHPIWQPSVQAGIPDSLLGHPVRESEYAPNTFTANLYAGAFGDPKAYRIVDFQGSAVLWKRHAEYLAGVDLSGTDQVGFSARKWTDAGPTDPQAWVRVQLGA